MPELYHLSVFVLHSILGTIPIPVCLCTLMVSLMVTKALPIVKLGTETKYSSIERLVFWTAHTKLRHDVARYPGFRVARGLFLLQHI